MKNQWKKGSWKKQGLLDQRRLLTEELKESIELVMQFTYVNLLR